MSATTLKKPEETVTSPSLTRLLSQLRTLFASVPAAKAPRIASKKLAASISALKNAPGEELIALRTVLSEMTSELDRLLGSAEVSVEEKRDAEKEDANVQRILAEARARQGVPAPAAGPKDAAESAAIMAEMRRGSAEALQRRIANKELLPSNKFLEALNIRRQSLSEAVKANRMFAMVGPSGENYYPAFYADAELDRRPLERVSKVLGQLPAASKYFFFTNKSVFLGGMTPLEALKKGRVADVLAAAAGFVDG
jgi:hypothetical protein